MTRAFVLSGGSSLGAIQVGMLHALFERDIAPDVIVGTSVGAINGAFIASRPPTVATAVALADVWRGLRRSTVFPANPLTGFTGFIGRRDHLVPNTKLRRVITRHLDADRLQDMPVALHVIVTDVLNGRELRLSRGPAIDAVMASAAIPGVFTPVQVAGRQMIDGGVSDNTPLSHAVALGADEIYVLPTGYACALTEHPRGALAMLLHAMSVMIAQRLYVEIALYSTDARIIVLPPPCPQHIQPIDFARAGELLERALDESRGFLDGLADSKRPADATAPAVRLLPHDHP